MKESNYIFPEGFLWGTATASHQIEGGQNNDWSRWEQSPRRLAYLKKRGLDPLQFISGLAANSWENLEKDIECIKKLNNNAYRFSIEWSRIEPEEGEFDEAAIEKYHHFIKRLKEEGIEPFVTIWHWPLPLWVAALGGWQNKGIIAYFVRYAEKIVTAFPEVKFWLTINEPQVVLSKGYLAGEWPPEKKNPLAYLSALHHLISGHRAAYSAIKNIQPQAQIGITHHEVYFTAGRGPVNRLIRYVADWLSNHWFLNKIRRFQDFVGVNYYSHFHINFASFKRDTEEKISDMGWGLCPEGLYYGLVGLKRYNLPIYITEHGLADSADHHRSWYITESLRQVHRAIREGADVRSYLHWSLLDNFEWSHGFGQKFGLFAVDRKTWERIPRPSVKVYAEIAKNNRL